MKYLGVILTIIVNKRLNAYGIVIDRITILGNILIPQEIKNALNSKVQMSQEAEKAKNEVAKAEAKAQTLLVQAKAEAEANRLKQQALTPELLQQMWIQKWDGRLPVYGYKIMANFFKTVLGFIIFIVFLVCAILFIFGTFFLFYELLVGFGTLFNFLFLTN